MSPRDDRELVQAYLHGKEEQAFRFLYRRHSPALYRLLLRLAGGRVTEAEDLLQTAWIRAAERLEYFRWESSLRTWLGGVAINCYREWLRHERRDGTLVPLEILDSSPAARARREISALDLEKAIARLPDGYREVLVLHDVEGYTHGEIGSLLGIRDGTSKSQLSRARNAVRRWLNQAEKRSDERRAV